MEKYLLTFEFRYEDSPKYLGERSQYLTKEVTIGVYEDFEEACDEGNKVLEIFESRFKLNQNYTIKERFSKNGGPFNFKKDLISNLGYLKTPFTFFGKITTLKYDSIEDCLDDVVSSAKRYFEFKKKEKEN